MAQLTDILREWSGGGSKRSQKPQLNRRETLADLARSLPWGRNNNENNSNTGPSLKKRRESSADSGIKSMKSRRDSHASELTKPWIRRDSPSEKEDVALANEYYNKIVISIIIKQFSFFQQCFNALINDNFNS